MALIELRPNRQHPPVELIPLAPEALTEPPAGPYALALTPSDDLAAMAGPIAEASLVVLSFTKFTDGRAFSTARRIREQLGYAGELRAVGEIIPDQLLFLARCGFDTALLPERFDPEQAAEALARYQVWYQPTGDGRPTARFTRQSPLAASDRP